LADSAGDRLPGLIMVSLRDRLPGPLSTLYHEAMHEVWHRMPEDTRGELVDHGDNLRRVHRLQPIYDAHWFARAGDDTHAGEAECCAFAGWCLGGTSYLGVVPPAIVIEAWRTIKEGRAVGEKPPPPSPALPSRVGVAPPITVVARIRPGAEGE
jgi:hypothetical protein